MNLGATSETSKLIDELRVLEKHYKKLKGTPEGKKVKATMKENAYQKGITLIKQFTVSHGELTMNNFKEFTQLKGIGKGISGKVKEFLETGKIHQVDDLRKLKKSIGKSTTEESTLEKFMNIWGVSSKTAQKLWDGGYRSIDSLKKDPSPLNDNQRVGLKYYAELQKPVPRKYIEVLNMGIQYILSSRFGLKSFKFYVGGSFRRGQPTSGDMDCILCSTSFGLKEAVDELRRVGIVREILACKNNKFMGIASCLTKGSQVIRLDIEFSDRENLGAMLIYFTGPKRFNTDLRYEAKKRGYLLNEFGLFKDRDRKVLLPSSTEREVLTALGMSYLPPHLR